MLFPNLDNLIVVEFKKVTKLTTCHRFLELNSFLESLPYILLRILIESTEMCRYIVVYLFGILFNKIFHILHFSVSFFCIKHMAIFKLNYVAYLTFLISFEN